MSALITAPITARSGTAHRLTTLTAPAGTPTHTARPGAIGTGTRAIITITTGTGGNKASPPAYAELREGPAASRPFGFSNPEKMKTGVAARPAGRGRLRVRGPLRQGPPGRWRQSLLVLSNFILLPAAGRSRREAGLSPSGPAAERNRP